MLWKSFKDMTEISRRRPHPILAISDLLSTQRVLTFCLDKNNLKSQFHINRFRHLMLWISLSGKFFYRKKTTFRWGLERHWIKVEFQWSAGMIAKKKCFYFCLSFFFDILHYLASMNSNTLFTFLIVCYIDDLFQHDHTMPFCYHIGLIERAIDLNPKCWVSSYSRLRQIQYPVVDSLGKLALSVSGIRQYCLQNFMLTYCSAHINMN